MSDYFDRLIGRAGRAPGPALVRPDRPLWTGPSDTAKPATDPLADAEASDEDQSREHPPGERPDGADVKQSSTDPGWAPRSGLGDRNPARSRRNRAPTESGESTAGDSPDPTLTGPETPAERFAAAPDDARAAPTPPFGGSVSETARRSGGPHRFDPKLPTEQAPTDDPALLAGPAAPSMGKDEAAGAGDDEFRTDGEFQADFGPDPDAETLRSELERVDALMFDAAGVGAAADVGGESAIPVVAPTSAAASTPDPPGSDRVHIDHLSIEIVGPPTAAHSPPQRRAGAVPRATAQLGSGPVAWRRS